MTPTLATRSTDLDRLEALSFQRYRQTQQIGSVWNETVDTLLAHRSVRSYLPTPVPQGAVELAVAAAQSAASSSNLQAWSVVVVEDKDRQDRLNVVAGQQRQIAEAPLFLVWLADLARPRAIATQGGSASEGLDYTESFLLGVIDAALAAQSAVVALESLGLGTCYIGAIRNDPETVARELGLPEGVFPVFGLTVGFPDPARPADVKPRLPQSTILHRERYSDETRRKDLAHYNEVLRRFQAEQAMPSIDWTDQVRNRIGTVEALKGRHVLAAVARRLGFALR